MTRSRESSSLWTEILIVILLMTILGFAMYISFRNVPTHTSTTMTSKTKENSVEPSQSKSTSTAMKSAMQTQKISHMVPITITAAPKATVVQSDASKVMQSSLVHLTPVKDHKRSTKNLKWNSKGIELKYVRVPRHIRRISEAK